MSLAGRRSGYLILSNSSITLAAYAEIFLSSIDEFNDEFIFAQNENESN